MGLRGAVDVVAGRRRRWTLLRSRRWGLAGRLGRGGGVHYLNNRSWGGPGSLGVGDTLKVRGTSPGGDGDTDMSPTTNGG